ncbi:MAG: glutathione transferase GstA [Methylobacillus sp.]|jgi:glutathione S-transferase|nr:glutathione transferase GstA [Methylobacillus sp.]
MKLYYAPGACSLASHIALRETGLTFELDKLDFATRKTAGGENFLSINPKGYVPALRLDNGEVLTEGAAILQYIADRGAARLIAAAGTMERYRTQEWLNFIATEIHKNYSPLFNKATPGKTRVLARERLTNRLGYVEAALAKSPYLVGGRYTVADIYLFVTLSWSRIVGFDLTPFPNVRDFQARVGARAAVREALKAEGLG